MYSNTLYPYTLGVGNNKDNFTPDDRKSNRGEIPPPGLN